MHGSAPWKTEETIEGLPRLLVLSVFSRFGGCHLSAPLSPFSSSPFSSSKRGRWSDGGAMRRAAIVQFFVETTA